MFTLIGVLLIILALSLYVLKKINKSIATENFIIEGNNAKIKEFNNNPEHRYERKRESKLKKIYPVFIKTRPLYILIFGILMVALNGLFFIADPGTSYSVQYLWGGDSMVATQGLKVKWWGRIIPITYEMSIKDIIINDKDLNENGVYELPKSEDGIWNRKAAEWEFSDAIKADIAISVIVGPDTDNEEAFLSMADKNRSESKLIYGRVLPNIDAALKNTCKLMDAQDYISGKASDFDRYFRDQLENGMYLVEEYYDNEEPLEVIGDTATIRTVGVVKKSSKQKKYKIKRDNQGNILRDAASNTLKQYGIRIYQAQITGIDWEDSFDKRLDKQKEEVALTQLEKQQAEREYYTMQKNIARGESEKAEERAILEKAQIKQTIAANTRALVAEQDLITEKKTYEVEQYKAKSKKVAADAIYYENNKRVQAGLTPQERATLELNKVTAVSANFAKMAAPSIVIIGGEGQSGDVTESLIQAAMAKQLLAESEKK